jgi:DNA-binding NarL/FixJ family response regulator
VSSEGGKLRLLIASEHRLDRETLTAALEREPDLEVVAQVADGTEAIGAAERVHAEVVLLSAGLPGFDGANPTCLLKDQAPECRIVVLADAQDQRGLTDGLGCGASGYLTMDCSYSELVEAVRGVARGEVLVPPTMLGPLLSELIERRNEHEEAVLRLSALSPRERQVLALVARGMKTTAISETLVISDQTTRTHIQNTLAKLEMHSRLEAASFVIANGLLDHLERQHPADGATAGSAASTADRG